MSDYFCLLIYAWFVWSLFLSHQCGLHILQHWSVNIQRANMSSLDQDQRLHPSCRDKTTVSSDSSDAHSPAKKPLQGLKLASHAVLEEAQQKGRLKCSKCGGSRMFFCYTCCSLVGVTPQEIPSIEVSKSLGFTWTFFAEKPSAIELQVP